jgi:hypothetical protein
MAKSSISIEDRTLRAKLAITRHLRPPEACGGLSQRGCDFDRLMVIRRVNRYELADLGYAVSSVVELHKLQKGRYDLESDAGVLQDVQAAVEDIHRVVGGGRDVEFPPLRWPGARPKGVVQKYS